MDEKKKEKSGQADFGLGGLFKGLNNLIDAATRLAETGEKFQKTGEINFSGMEKIKGLKDLRGVYGVNIRTLSDGSPQFQSFSNIKPGSKGPVVEEVREPIVDLFEGEEGIQVVAEMPGVEEEEIDVTLTDDILTISTTGGSREYRKEVLLSSPANEKSLSWSYKNGILEVTIG